MGMNAQGLASLGRGGDDQIGHLTTGEKVLPLPVAQDPSVQKVINQSFAKHGLNADQYTVGHADNSVNPLTDYPEYGLGKAFKKLGKAFRKVAQVVGTVVGFAIGGPAGAAAGSAIGGGVRRGKFDLKNAVTDAAGGYGVLVLVLAEHRHLCGVGKLLHQQLVVLVVSSKMWAQMLLHF